MAEQQEKARDPVCGMRVDPSGPRRVAHAGTTFHFCGEKCLTRFQDNSAQFLG